MTKTNSFENEWLLHIFNNAAIADIGNGAGLPAGVAGNLYVSLHTGDPGEGGTQATNETGYTGYNRIPVVRSAAGWEVTASSCSPAADIDFDECTGAAGGDLSYFGVGKEAGTGGTDLLYSGTLTPNITMAIGVIPRIKTTTTITED